MYLLRACDSPAKAASRFFPSACRRSGWPWLPRPAPVCRRWPCRRGRRAFRPRGRRRRGRRLCTCRSSWVSLLFSFYRCRGRFPSVSTPRPAGSPRRAGRLPTRPADRGRCRSGAACSPLRGGCPRRRGARTWPRPCRGGRGRPARLSPPFAGRCFPPPPCVRRGRWPERRRFLPFSAGEDSPRAPWRWLRWGRPRRSRRSLNICPCR